MSQHVSCKWVVGFVGALMVVSPLAVTSARAAPSVYDQIGPGVATANPRDGQPNNVIAPAYNLVEVARGSDPLENPSGLITRYGFLNDFPPQTIEPSKTEPDENTYLRLDHNPGGPTAGYDYGRNFVYQGHENGGDSAYITRVNLDVTDPAHRITLLTPVGPDGKTNLNRIDGSTWNPISRTLLFTQENGNQSGVAQLSADWGGAVQRLDGVMGRAGYEGIHPDSQGNLLMVEDVGGTRVNVVPNDANSARQAAQPNSFVYRFVPTDAADLSKGGKLQALQVAMNGQPLTFNAADPLGDTHSTAQLNLHTAGSSFPVKWVTIHDTAVDGFQPYDANALAKAASATPFKRPENGQFQPGTNFKTFFFTATGDTNSLSGGQSSLAARGAWGAIFRLDFNADGTTGRISLFALGDAAHSSFDNLIFADGRTLLVAEDRGDGLHRQLNVLDSVWAYDAQDPNAPARRFLALGRDSLSRIDAGFLDAATAGFQNDGDNEPTGLFVSTGGTSLANMLGQDFNASDARWFLTQQHGANSLFEITAVPEPSTWLLLSSGLSALAWSRFNKAVRKVS